MMQLVVAALAAAMVAAIFVAYSSLRMTPEKPPTERNIGSVSLVDKYKGYISRRTAVALAVGFIAGLLLFAVTGFIALMFAVPVAAVGIPVLISNPEASQLIDRLEALEEWTRNLAGVLTAGVGLEEAIAATARSAPKPIETEVKTLLARLRAQWSTEDALRAFADDVNDSTGDLIAASLILGAERRGVGLASVLDGLAKTVSDEVRDRRAIEADRAKPRTTSRWLTLLSMGFLALLFLTGNYVDPYKSAIGQIILLLLLSLYGGCLIWLRRTTMTKPIPRFIHRRDLARLETTA